MATIGNLYSKSILVRLTNSKSEDRYKPIHITVDYQTTAVPTHKTELIIKLTDEHDPFFLYSLYLSEEDYQILKQQQGLLVDFSAFGQRFIDLLCACEKDEKSDNPKFQLQFYSNQPLPYDHDNGSLNIIEINPFKHLCHLSLQFKPGNDNDVKKYLANCLKKLRDDFNRLSSLYEETKNNLTQKLESTQQVLSNKNVEVDKLRVELDAQSEKLITKHMQELNFERDKSLQNQYAMQQKYEKEKKDLELNLMKTIKQLETRLNELEFQNKDLLEKKYKNESQLQEFHLKNNTLQEEFNLIKNELANLRKQNTNLDSELHSNEKTANQLRTRIAVLEQELKDKVETINKTQELLNNERNQNKQIDDLLKEKTNELKKKQNEINHYIQEFKKGNEVVIKLQDREKHLHGQVKLKAKILTEQEKVMREKEKEIDDLKAELKELKLKFTNMSDENTNMKNEMQKKNQELEQMSKMLKRDESVINWLNKQITEHKIATSTGGAKLPNMYNDINDNLTNGNSLAFKPIGSLSSTSASNLNQVQIDMSLGMMRLNGTTTGTSNTNQFLNKSNDIIDSNRRLLMQTGSTANSNQLQLINSNGTYQTQRGPLSSGSSSSLQQSNDVHKENQEIGSPNMNGNRLNGSNGDLSSSKNSTTNGGTNSGGSTRLDPKYFQSNSPQLSTALDVVSIRPQMMRQSLTTTTNTASSNTLGRIANKQLYHQGSFGGTSTTTSQQQPIQTAQLVNCQNGVATKSTPSLASAYFPTN